MSGTFVRLFVGFFLCARGASCPIEFSPPSVVVKHGDPVSVNCSTSDSNYIEMGWEVPVGGSGVKNATHLNWNVRFMEVWDISPECYINPRPGSDKEQCSMIVDVVVYKFPESIGISSNGEPDGVMKEGQQYKFTCDIRDVAPVQNVTVKWYKGETLFQTHTFDNRSRKPVDQVSVISFTPMREDNRVKFRCVAHLDLEPEGPLLNVSSREYTITVHFGPDVNCSGGVDIREGETLRSRCPVKGNPTPLVKWLKDGKSADPDRPVHRKDAGQYTVTTEGDHPIHIPLKVLVLYGPELTCPSNYTAMENTPHNLTCTVEGYPRPKISWYKDGEEVQLPVKFTRTDAGQYDITASNTFSSINVKVDVTVLYPPSQIEIELEESEVELGSTVGLKCSSKGHPRPKYSWIYSRSANVMEQNEDGVSWLIIHNATALNMGLYTCHAWNERGNVSGAARLTVKVLLILGLLSVSNGTNPSVRQEDLIEITPESLVVEYNEENQKATCDAPSTDPANVKEIYWEVQRDVKINNRTWLVDSHRDWNAVPTCIVKFEGIGTLKKSLNFTLYKLPDSVSIHPVGNLIAAENTELQLRCNIIGVAPAGSLTVRWYHWNKTTELPNTGSLQVMGCLSENNPDCDINVVKTPVNVSSTINITLDREHNGRQFWCEAQLNVEPVGQQLPPNFSSPLNITVYYKPTINTTKLPKFIPVIRGYPEELECEADGHPPPKIQWLYSSDKVPRVSGGKLNVSEAGFYNCSATNEVDSSFHQVEVVLKEDYLPLIAGLVAITVLVISVIFIFIYSIYYKNTKMQQYSLKNPKLSTHNGNVAHNGWEQQLPMTKLS